MPNQQTLTQFFSAKTFLVPKYQRSYAWEKQNVRELFEDIKEAFDTNANHYVGTIVLAKTEDRGVFNVVDGQQRLTTIVMLINSIISTLKKDDRDFYKRSYIKQSGIYKLTPLERDKNFFFSILDGNLKVDPENKSQRYMLDAYEEIGNLITAHDVEPQKFLSAIESLSILEFIEDHESDAIRIFLTVNDRGRELSRMDKMKSLLFYYSNKYLSGKYDSKINDVFAEIFELYDDIKLTGEEQKINVISSKQFSEDDLLRHHHICFSNESYDPTGQQVLENVKFFLINCRKVKDFKKLDDYVVEYLNSLLEYVRAFKKIISRTIVNEEYYKIFVILGLSVSYYPVITQLEINNILDALLPTKKISGLKMVEIIDVRVLKIREYAGRKHIAEFVALLNKKKLTHQKIEDHLVWFNSYEIGNDRFKDYLANYDYFKQTGLLRILFIDYCERLRKNKYTISELRDIMKSEPTIEHILSQTPNFKPRTFGFKNKDDYEEAKNLLGNLTLLEKKINSSIQNSDLVEKLKGYSKSKFQITKALGTSLSVTGTFTKTDLVNRGQNLVDDLVIRWWA